MKKTSREAQLLHTPYEKADAYHALNMPVYNSVAYEFDTAEAMADAFCGISGEHFYSRITNPTVGHFEEKVRALTGALSVTALNSGMAAISNTFLSLASAGMNIITSPHLFGNTYSFFQNTLAQLGIEVRFCNLTNTEEVWAHVDRNTCAIFLEVITNPQMEVASLNILSAIGRRQGIPLIVDTTVVPFTHFKAKNFGIDIEIVSSTKYISGGATSLGGLVIDYGTFPDWKRFPALEKWSKPDPKAAFTTRLRKEIHRNLGAYMTPQTASLQSLGLDTLSVRYERQAATCLELAKRLELMEGVVSVNYPTLKTNMFHAVSQAQFGMFAGAMLTFDLVSREACFGCLNRLKMIRRATNLFDNKSLAIHPASTIYGTYTDEQRTLMGVKQETIRLSVGLESADDLLYDIEQAL